MFDTLRGRDLLAQHDKNKLECKENALYMFKIMLT